MPFPAEILATGVGIADKLTKGVQAPFTLEAYLSEDGAGLASFAAPVTLLGVVDQTRRQVAIEGLMVVVVATITVVGDVTPNGAPGRNEPIDPRDRITLPDGTTGPIIDAPGAVVNPLMGRPFVNTILIGELKTT
jgi:hypothetical protein